VDRTAGQMDRAESYSYKKWMAAAAANREERSSATPDGRIGRRRRGCDAMRLLNPGGIRVEEADATEILGGIKARARPTPPRPRV